MDINEEVKLDAACEAYARHMTALRMARKGQRSGEYIELQESLCYRRMLATAFHPCTGPAFVVNLPTCGGGK